MKMQDVRTKAKAMGINSFGKSKVELIREIQRKEGNLDCYGRSGDSCDQEECCFRDSCLNQRK